MEGSSLAGMHSQGAGKRCIGTCNRFEVEADSRIIQDPRFAVVTWPRGIQPLSVESTNARGPCGIQLTIHGIQRAVTMKMSTAYAVEERATAVPEAVNPEASAKRTAHMRATQEAA